MKKPPGTGGQGQETATNGGLSRSTKVDVIHEIVTLCPMLRAGGIDDELVLVAFPPFWMGVVSPHQHPTGARRRLLAGR